MKDFGKMFSRRYSAVCVSDEEAGVNANQPNQMATNAAATQPKPNASSTQTAAAATATSLPEADPATAAAALAALQRAQRRKSLKANRSMKPMDILGSFFDERQHGKHNARSPTRKFRQQPKIT